MKDIWHLQDLDWLSELSTEERERLRAASVPVRCEAGEIVFMPVPNPASVYLLEDGLVRIYRLSEQGYVQPGEVFGELAVFGDYPRESFAQTVKPSRVWKIPRQSFQPFMKSRTGLVLGITKQIGARLKRVESRVENLVFRDVPTRVKLVLLELAEHFGIRRDDGSIEIGVQITQAELATLVGSTRQTVNASLKDLTDHGLIGHAGRQLLILKPEELQRSAHPSD
jgi:CRP-like cAMP-binding protein